MFVSNNMNPGKKKFQKPNILRRKANIIKKSPIIISAKEPEDNKFVTIESPEIRPLPILPSVYISANVEKAQATCINATKSVHSKSVVQNKLIAQNTELTNTKDITPNVSSNSETILCIDNEMCINNNEIDQNEAMVNVESFLVSDPGEQNFSLFENETLLDKDIENQGKQKWCLDFGQDSQKIIIEHYDSSEIGSLYLEQKSDILSTMVPLSAVSSIQQPEPEMLEQPVTNIKNISIEQLIHTPIRFKCDVGDCKKEFMSEEKLKKHKNVHNKDSIPRVPRQTTIECPVKRMLIDGVEDPCGKTFRARDDLMKHLNEEHTMEEALYKCAECGRRFFWASGLRAHGRSHAARGALLACPWAGCGRAFRQPCRLREHARKHTGDKPYPCRFPNCGWSFRTASKLVRHARRHTGERRHACAACGRAFLRREHLRDHAARHHAPHARRAHACPHAGCQQSFTNMSTLYMHMKKVHRKEEGNPDPAPTPAVNTEALQQDLLKPEPENLFMVSLLEPTESLVTATESEVSIAEEVSSLSVASEDGHAARTHCTWPLPRDYHYHTDACVLEDVQVEQSEGSENNIYTVRSDLFLHGNVLHNEDSEQMERCTRSESGEGGQEDEGGAGGLALPDLLLAPSHHLDQEELYTDAVDESSFRVFLLSGEDLA